MAIDKADEVDTITEPSKQEESYILEESKQQEIQAIDDFKDVEQANLNTEGSDPLQVECDVASLFDSLNSYESPAVHDHHDQQDEKVEHEMTSHTEVDWASGDHDDVLQQDSDRDENKQQVTTIA